MGTARIIASLLVLHEPDEPASRVHALSKYSPLDSNNTSGILLFQLCTTRLVLTRQVQTLHSRSHLRLMTVDKSGY